MEATMKLYRLLRMDEDPINDGLQAKDKHANTTMKMFVESGSKLWCQSQYISCSKTLDVAHVFATNCIHNEYSIAEINATDLPPEVVITDISDGSNFEKRSMPYHFARKFQEVLLEGNIPRTCILKVTRYIKTDERPFYRMVHEDVRSCSEQADERSPDKKDDIHQYGDSNDVMNNDNNKGNGSGITIQKEYQGSRSNGDLNENSDKHNKSCINTRRWLDQEVGRIGDLLKYSEDIGGSGFCRTKMKLYRLLRLDENPINDGLQAKNKHANITMKMFVESGSKPWCQSQYISCSKTLDIAHVFATNCIHKEYSIAEINATDLPPEVVITDISDGSNFEKRSMPYHFVRKFQEVLLEGDIPSTCILKVTRYIKTDERPFYRMVHEDVRSCSEQADERRADQGDDIHQYCGRNDSMNKGDDTNKDSNKGNGSFYTQTESNQESSSNGDMNDDSDKHNNDCIDAPRWGDPEVGRNGDMLKGSGEDNGSSVDAVGGNSQEDCEGVITIEDSDEDNDDSVDMLSDNEQENGKTVITIEDSDEDNCESIALRTDNDQQDGRNGDIYEDLGEIGVSSVDAHGDSEQDDGRKHDTYEDMDHDGSFVSYDDSTTVFYRLLRLDEDPIRDGLKAKDKQATESVFRHVALGSNYSFSSQYISCSKTLEAIHGFARNCNHIEYSIAEIDVAKLPHDADTFDLSDGFDFEEGTRLFNYVRKAKEVLLKGDIPSACIRKVTKYIKVSEWPFYKMVSEVECADKCQNARYDTDLFLI